MLVKSAVVMADDLKAAAVLVFTVRGHMARYTAWMRPRYSPILAFCEKWETADSLSINWGIKPFVIHFNHDFPEKTIETAINLLLEQGTLKRGQTAVIISAISSGDQIVDAVQMRVV